mmetsp:Transcript_18591/g.20749  ORF Transcript_18591/g.20749 Transcript_18591/m.20749 type:complete len:254 (+) Transcript_18591:45-806(+)
MPPKAGTHLETLPCHSSTRLAFANSIDLLQRKTDTSQEASSLGLQLGLLHLQHVLAEQELRLLRAVIDGILCLVVRERLVSHRSQDSADELGGIEAKPGHVPNAGDHHAVISVEGDDLLPESARPVVGPAAPVVPTANTRSSGAPKSAIVKLFREDFLSIPLALIEPQVAKPAKVVTRGVEATINQPSLAIRPIDKERNFLPEASGLETDFLWDESVPLLLYGATGGHAPDALHALPSHLVVLVDCSNPALHR